MKILRDVIILTFVIVGLLFARSERDINRVNGKDNNVNNKHYWVKDHADDDKNQLDRKRTHKRRRKIKKPVKGLR